MDLIRYAAEISFPPYAFVPGTHPHPTSDLDGHSFGMPGSNPDRIDPENPQRSRDYLAAIDLFNAGFYWEAHETWEGLWVASGKTGIVADFLKGLIKLAAAGVKARAGRLVGVQRHARRAHELFQSVRAAQPATQTEFCGLSLEELIRVARQLFDHPLIDETPSVGGRRVFDFVLTLKLPEGTSM
jgi:hypothetical protein